MNELKRHLFDAYNGFADKRIKNLNKANTFIVDDRSENDENARGDLFSWFCMIFATVLGPDKVEIQLRGNIPESEDILAWINEHDLDYSHAYGESSLTLPITLGKEHLLDSLAQLVSAIVRTGAPRYSVKSYKFVCPRVAASLRRLANVLREYEGPRQGGGFDL